MLRLAQIQTRMPDVMIERERRDVYKRLYSLREQYKRLYSLREQFIFARLCNGVCLCIKGRSLVGQ